MLRNSLLFLWLGLAAAGPSLVVSSPVTLADPEPVPQKKSSLEKRITTDLKADFERRFFTSRSQRRKHLASVDFFAHIAASDYATDKSLSVSSNGKEGMQGDAVLRGMTNLSSTALLKDQTLIDGYFVPLITSTTNYFGKPSELVEDRERTALAMRTFRKFLQRPAIAKGDSKSVTQGIAHIDSYVGTYMTAATGKPEHAPYAAIAVCTLGKGAPNLLVRRQLPTFGKLLTVGTDYLRTAIPESHTLEEREVNDLTFRLDAQLQSATLSPSAYGDALATGKFEIGERWRRFRNDATYDLKQLGKLRKSVR